MTSKLDKNLLRKYQQHQPDKRLAFKTFDEIQIGDRFVFADETQKRATISTALSVPEAIDSDHSYGLWVCHTTAGRVSLFPYDRIAIVNMGK